MSKKITVSFGSLIVIVMMSWLPICGQDGETPRPAPCKWPMATIGLPSTSKDANAVAADDPSEVNVEPLPAPWKLLDFHGKRQIREIRLVWFKYRTVFGQERVLPDLFDARSLTGETLRAVQRGLDFATRPAAERSGISFMGDLPIGQLQICTFDEVIVIAIHKDTFGLATEYVSSRDMFWSWRLARVIDSLYFRNTGGHLPNEVIEGLSGNKWGPMPDMEEEKQKDEMKK